jgi:WD40 repeat protein
VVTASDDRTAQVWGIDDGRPTAPPLQHDDKVDFAVFSPDGHLVITQSADKPARLWDALTGLAFTKPMPHNDDIPLSTVFGEKVTAPFNHKIAGQIAQNRKGHRVATVSDDGTARVWDISTGHPISPPIKHAGIITDVALSRDGRRIFTAS